MTTEATNQVQQKSSGSKVRPPESSLQQTKLKTYFKTKAKKRYLKAKKDRRKKRKSTAVPASSAQPAEEYAERPDHEDSDEESDAGRSVPDEEGGDRSEVEDESMGVKEKPAKEKKAKRPKKRRRVETKEDELEDGMDVDEPVHGAQEEADVPADEPPEPPLERSPTPQVALPLFPLPKQPDAPSKSTLALQGLDQALVEAELVDPQQTTSLLSATDEEDLCGLSAKVRLRLKDLGISELFAGALFGSQSRVRYSYTLQCRRLLYHSSFRIARSGPYIFHTAHHAMSVFPRQQAAGRPSPTLFPSWRYAPRALLP